MKPKKVNLLRYHIAGKPVAAGAMVCVALLSGSYAAQSEMTKLTMDITNGPREYYTPDAYSYFAAKGTSLPPQKSQKEAIKSFKATMRVAAMGAGGGEALSVLVEMYPRGIHITEAANLRYTGEGTFDDWVQTYVTNEKNKFLLSSPFFSYNEMAQLENFVTGTPQVARLNGEPVTIPTKDPVNISVIHTVYFGAHALSAISGRQFGTDGNRWLEWWNNGGKNAETGSSAIPASSSFTAASPGTQARLRSGQLFSEIVLHGKYHMYLSTGDDLVGRVESKDEESLILETGDGKAYTFRPSIILRYEYLEPPKLAAVPSGAAAAARDSLPFSFDELRGRTVGTRPIEVRINNGMVFRGTLKQIDEKQMQLRVGGSVIPITRDVVTNIQLVREQAPVQSKEKSPAASKPAGRDTVVAKNGATDEWGKPKPDFIYTGSIIDDNGSEVVIKTNDGTEKRILRTDVVRVVKNSTESYEAIIKRYAEPLFCPGDMFFVDIPPGKQGRPFFKVCVDRYEYPNVKGGRPKTGASYDDARTLCSKRGKRLCTSDEWQWACGGLEGYTYPYGWNPEKEKCNTDDTRPPEESGTRVNCVGKFGGYDMVGNVFEWVTGPNKQPALMGGPHSKCQTITEGVGGGAKPNSGFRCCKSN